MPQPPDTENGVALLAAIIGIGLISLILSLLPFRRSKSESAGTERNSYAGPLEPPDDLDEPFHS